MAVALEPSWREQLAETVKAPASKEALDSKFFEALGKRLDDVNARERKSRFVRLSISGFLAITLLSIGLSLSIFGMSAGDGRKLREILLIVSSIEQADSIGIALDRVYIFAIMNPYLEQISKRNAHVRFALNLRFGIPNSVVSGLSFDEISRLSRDEMILFILTAISTFVYTSIHLIFLFFVQVATIISILVDPTVSLKFSILVVAYVLMVDAASAGTKLLDIYIQFKRLKTNRDEKVALKNVEASV